jgi:hypothetical protein
MAAKKIEPKNPAKDTSEQVDTKPTSRKTATGNHRFRKTPSLRGHGGA